ncbi:MAG: PadR family transcriptional regulator [Dermatophilaceae bacterium]
MSAIRLFVLGTLDRGGPMHGHQIRRAAQVDRTELWTDFKAGSIYAALPRMAADGTVTVSHSEKVGNRPERTVYAITEAGRAELAAVRDAALTWTGLRPDVVDLGLQNAHDLSLPGLRRIFESRIAAITASVIAWQNQRDAAAPHISPREALGFAHTNLRLEAEAAWCRQVLELIEAEGAAADQDVAAEPGS